MASHRPPKTLVWRADEPTRPTPPPRRVAPETSGASSTSSTRSPPSRIASPSSTGMPPQVRVPHAEEVPPRLKSLASLPAPNVAPEPPHGVPTPEPAAPAEPHVLEPEDEFLQSASPLGVRHFWTRHRSIEVVRINRGSVIARTLAGKRSCLHKVQLLYLYELGDLPLIRRQRVKCEATRALGLQPAPAPESPSWPLEWLDPVVGEGGARLVVTFIDGWQLSGVVRERSRFAFRLELAEGGQIWAYRHAVAGVERHLPTE